MLGVLAGQTIPLERSLRAQASERGEQYAQSLARLEQRLVDIRDHPDHQQHLERASVAASDRCAELHNTVRLIVLLANDSVNGTRKAQTQLQELIRADIQAWSEPYARDIQEAQSAFEREVAEIHREAAYLFGTEWKQAAALSPANSATVLPEGNLIPLRKLGISSAILGGSLALDVVGLSRSRLWATLPEGVAGLTWRIFRGKAMQAGTAASIGLMDGPIPIGNMIAAAGLVWTLYDIHTALNLFQLELNHEIGAALQTHRDELHKQTLDAAKESVDQHQRSLYEALRALLGPTEAKR
jgi:hypothetical protein